MDNIRRSIILLFEHGNPNQIIDNFNNFSGRMIAIRKEEFIAQFSFSYNHLYTMDEIESLYYLVIGKWARNPDWIDDDPKGTSIFNVLYAFAYYGNVLVETGDVPEVNFPHLLRWRSLSYQIGEDLLTSAYLAYKDLKSGKERKYFGWKPVLSSNNFRIKELMKKPITDNHSHLKGASPHLEISWISLMNDITFRKDQFKEFYRYPRQNPDLTFGYSADYMEFRVLVLKAVIIRIILFIVAKGEVFYEDNKAIVDRLRFILGEKTLRDLQVETSYLQGVIKNLKRNFGHQYGDEIFDYAIAPIDTNCSNSNGDKVYNGFSLLAGERILLYDIFKGIYSRDNHYTKFEGLMYAYLLIKTRYRKEILQVNDRVGFHNFVIYEGRKDIFLKPNSIYESAMYNLAINGSLRYPKGVCELRVAPRKTTTDYIHMLRKIDESAVKKEFFLNSAPTDKLKSIGGETKKTGEVELQDRYMFTVHFIKSKEGNFNHFPKDKILLEVLCRNHQLRAETRQRAIVLSRFIQKGLRSSHRICMVDACNTEIGCRPEVFAQAFRYIRKHGIKKQSEFQPITERNALGFTYHVGEDFIDIIDGLRAIDEAIVFLNLRVGDRMGHCLALGINAKRYYDSKSNLLVISKHALMDNIAWILAMCRRFNIDLHEQRYQLERLFSKHYSYVYDDFEQKYREKLSERPNANETIDYNAYFDAWKLRGDSPESYKCLRYSDKIERNTSQLLYWDQVGLNFMPDIVEDLRHVRQKRKVIDLYAAYHFNESVKRRGDEITEFRITDDYRKLVGKMQVAMRNEIAKRHISIETNPSSNIVIGTDKKYEDLPLFIFNNYGLSDKKPYGEQQLHVSINTDDQGIFATDLENEYALLALSLEKSVDPETGAKRYHQNEIYAWLDMVREMGCSQTKIDTGQIK